MKIEDLSKEVIEIIAEIAEYDVKDIQMDSNLAEEVGINSLMGLEVMVMIERKYKIKLKEEDIVKMRTPRDIIGLIEVEFAAIT